MCTRRDHWPTRSYKLNFIILYLITVNHDVMRVRKTPKIVNFELKTNDFHQFNFAPSFLTRNSQAFEKKSNKSGGR